MSPQDVYAQSVLCRGKFLRPFDYFWFFHVVCVVTLLLSGPVKVYELAIRLSWFGIVSAHSSVWLSTLNSSFKALR